MKLSSILCLITMGLLVSILQQASSGPAPARVECVGGQRLCGEECVAGVGYCSCNGPCTERERNFTMKAGFSEIQAIEMMSQGISYSPYRV